MTNKTMLDLCREAVKNPSLYDRDAMRDYVMYHHSEPVNAEPDNAGVIVDTIDWLMTLPGAPVRK